MTDLQSLTERIEAVTTDSELLSVARELRNSVLNANLGQPMLGVRFSGPIQSLWKRAQSMDCPIVEPNTNYVQGHILVQLNQLIEWAESKVEPVTPMPETNASPSKKEAAAKGGWDEKATALFLKNPTWNKIQLAKHLGCNSRSLAPKRCPMLTLAIKTSKAPTRKVAKGTKDTDGSLEAWEG